MGLDLQNIVRSAVGVAVEVFDQVAVAGTYSNVTGSAYTPGSGQATPTKTDVACSPLITSYKEREVDGQRVQQGDEKLVIEQWRLKAGGINELTVNDYFTETATSIRRNVIDFFTDPTRQVSIIHVRRVTKRTS